MVTHLLPPLVFFISFSIYLFTAQPSIYWRDASEFQAVSFLLDIAHPAGSPLYSIIAKAGTFIPMGSVAFKVTLVSSFFGAAISVVFYRVIQSVFKVLSSRMTSPPPASWVDWIGFFSTLVLSFSQALWENSNQTEVYTVQNFFTILFIFILLQLPPFIPNLVYPKERTYRLLFIFSFLFGLSLGAHAILILYLPFLFLWILFTQLKIDFSTVSLRAAKPFFLLLFFFLLGFSIYFYLPIRSAQDPYYDWGDPERFQNLMLHVSDRKDAEFHTNVPSKNILFQQFSMYLKFCLDNFSFLGVLLGLIGLSCLIVKKEGRVIGLLSLFFLPPFLFFIRYWGENSAFIPTFLIFALLIGVGLWEGSLYVSRQLKGTPFTMRYSGLAWILLGVQFVFLFSNHYGSNSKRVNYWAAREIMKGMLERLPPDSVVFSYHTLFGFNYLQQVEAHRPDVTILGLTTFLAPDLFTRLEKSRFQNVSIPNASPKDMGPLFLTENIESHPIYWEPIVEHNKLVADYLVPDGLLFRINPAPFKLNDDTTRSHLSKLPVQIPFDDISDEMEEKNFYAQLLCGQGAFFLEKDAYETALIHFKMATAIVPNDTAYLNMLGITYAYLNNFKVAEEVLLQSVSADPENHEPYLNLGMIYMKNNAPLKAELYFKRVIELYPNHLRALLSLGKLSAEQGDKKKGLDYFRKALEIKSDFEEARKEMDLLLKQM